MKRATDLQSTESHTKKFMDHGHNKGIHREERHTDHSTTANLLLPLNFSEPCFASFARATELPCIYSSKIRPCTVVKRMLVLGADEIGVRSFTKDTEVEVMVQARTKGLPSLPAHLLLPSQIIYVKEFMFSS